VLHRKTEKERQVADGKGKEGWARSLVLYNHPIFSGGNCLSSIDQSRGVKYQPRPLLIRYVRLSWCVTPAPEHLTTRGSLKIGLFDLEDRSSTYTIGKRIRSLSKEVNLKMGLRC
jgi:hypothetical protein